MGTAVNVCLFFGRGDGICKERNSDRSPWRDRVSHDLLVPNLVAARRKRASICLRQIPRTQRLLLLFPQKNFVFLREPCFY